jgi:Calcineurin-like phosphoesterase
VAEDIQTFRDHILSIYQSAVSEVARRIDAEPRGRSRSGIRRSATSLFPDYAAEIARHEYAHKHGLPIPPSPASFGRRALTAGDAARTCAELALRYLKARLRGDLKALAEIQGQFTAGTCDPAWASTIEEYLQYFGSNGSRRQIPYIRASTVGARIIEFNSKARVALVGDWGTGGQPAIHVLKQIASFRPDVFIHLGDIYYSGTPAECASNFTSFIDSILRSRNPDLAAYTLSGNHDMYCGGVGYYDLIQHLNPDPLKQPASFFCLRSADEKWQLLAMDTGLHDYSPLEVDDAVTFIEEDELEWHRARLKEFPGRTIILTHHQLFSAFSPIGEPDQYGRRSALNPHLFKAFNLLKDSGRICAWFWGHEHTLSIYEPFAGLTKGRCLGHGAVPVPARDKIYDPVPGLDHTPTIVPNTQLQQQEGVYTHGYAVLAFEASSCSVEYYQDIDGRPALVYPEIIQ